MDVQVTLAETGKHDLTLGDINFLGLIMITLIDICIIKNRDSVRSPLGM